MDKYYTTKKLIGGKKAELWRQFISETFVELDCNGMSRNDFFGELRARSVGDLGISTITTDAYDVFVQTEGSATIRQLDREVILNPGDFTIYDSTMPYHLHFANRLSQLVVKVPRKHLKRHLQSPETLTALHARVTTNFAQTLFNETDALNTKTQEQVAETFVSLLTSSIREATSEIERAPRNKATQLLRIKQFIAQNLRNPELDLHVIANSQNISERYLHTLFESESITPSRFIWNERLKSTHIDLSNPLLLHRSISEICFSWGFSDTTHFSRAFKAKYERSPRAYRKIALAE